jgi:hypothetical protein
MKKLIFITLIFLSFQAVALEKCVVNGVTVYTKRGCPKGEKLMKPSDKFIEIESSRAKQIKIERNAAIAERNLKQDPLRVLKEDTIEWKR